MGVLSGSDSDTVWLEGLSDSGVTNGIIRSSWLLDEPWLEGFKLLHVLDSLRDIPDLYRVGLVLVVVTEVVLTVGIHHQDTSSGTGVLVGNRGGVDLSASRHVLWVVDNRSDEETSSEIIVGIGSDLELQTGVSLFEIPRSASLTLKWLKPCSSDESVRRLTFSSEYPVARSASRALR